MSNLLPKREQTLLKKEYSLRRIIVLLFLFSAVLGISFVLLFPSYILSRVNKTEAAIRLQAAQRTMQTKSGDDISASVRDAKDKARALQISQKMHSVYDLVRLFEKKSEEIKINEMYYNRSEEGVVTLAIKGKAGTRESLTAFRRQLEAQPEFLSINLPISNFAKDRNIEFSVDIVVKNP